MYLSILINISPMASSGTLNEIEIELKFNAPDDVIRMCGEILINIDK